MSSDHSFMKMDAVDVRQDKRSMRMKENIKNFKLKDILHRRNYQDRQIIS